MWRRRLKKVGLLLGAGLLLLILVGLPLGIGAEYYTSQPQFCGSCHIMDPYYESWSDDVHAGSGHAACVDCHYAPGEQHTFMAKFRGLSQLASYFSGRAGAGRPKAHVNDASCLTSACHGDRKFMTAELSVGSVPFSHAAHLDPEGAVIYANRSELTDLRIALADAVGADRLTEIERIGRSLQPVDERTRELVTWLHAQGLDDHRDAILAYVEYLHTEVRIDQLSELKCASCHQFDTTLGDHFRVAKTSCYTCHFTNQAFNTATGKCLTCHEPPSGPVAVHGGPHAVSQTTTTTATMDHATIVANGVDCRSCHDDLIHGTGRVTDRDCRNCHDQDRFLENFDGRTTETVRDYHRVHAAGQRARCNDCHTVIEHRLLDAVANGGPEALLSPVQQDCQHCHPNHHREQTKLLVGRGGFVEDVAGVANPMTGSRVTCRGCHLEPATDPHVGTVVTGTLTACRNCHSDDYEQLFDQWRHAIDARLTEATELLTATETRLKQAMEQSRPGVEPAGPLVTRARDNVRLVTNANGIHNKNYAMMLLDQAIIDLRKASSLLRP